jgi:hypothetical protein
MWSKRWLTWTIGQPHQRHGLPAFGYVIDRAVRQGGAASVSQAVRLLQ